MSAWAVAVVIAACARGESTCESLEGTQADSYVQKSHIASVTRKQSRYVPTYRNNLPACRDKTFAGALLQSWGCGWFTQNPSYCVDIYFSNAGLETCCSCGGGYRYASVGIGECMTPQGPRGNHCYDGPSFSRGTVRTREQCQEKCDNIGHCSAFEWGRNNHYNCALYIHTSTTNPPELSPQEWTCNFWSAGPDGVNEVSRAHNFGHSGECFVEQTSPDPVAKAEWDGLDSLYH